MHVLGKTVPRSYTLCFVHFAVKYFRHIFSSPKLANDNIVNWQHYHTGNIFILSVICIVWKSDAKSLRLILHIIGILPRNGGRLPRFLQFIRAAPKKKNFPY